MFQVPWNLGRSDCKVEDGPLNRKTETLRA